MLWSGEHCQKIEIALIRWRRGCKTRGFFKLQRALTSVRLKGALKDITSELLVLLQHLRNEKGRLGRLELFLRCKFSGQIVDCN